jgi:hypothetical protein
MGRQVIEIRELPGTDMTIRQAREMTRRTRRGIRHAWFAIGDDLYRSANNEILKGRKSGIKYPNLRNRSSAPFETFANQSGRLRRSLGWKVHGYDSLEFGYGVTGQENSNPAPGYAKWMEDGTPGGKMLPRPTLQNALKDVNRNNVRSFEICIKHSVERKN